MPVVTIDSKNKASQSLTKDDRERIKNDLLCQPREYENFIDAYLKYTEHQESTEKIHTWVAISCIAAALERKVHLDAGHFKIYPNLYTFIIGNSGEVRKSTSTGIGFDLVKSTGTIKLMSERLTDRSLIDQLQRSKSDYYVNAPRFESQSAVYAYASELVVFMREVAGSISELLTTFWDCPEQWTYETKMDGQISINGPCLNLLGASTPTWLQRAIPVEEMEGGLASRIIFVVEMNPPERYNAWGAPNIEGIKEMRKKLVKDLKRISLLSGKFTYTKEAYEFYEKWYIDHRKSNSSITDIRFKGYYSRKPVTVWKLAMILCVAESDTLQFDKRHLERALELLNDIEGSMLSAFGGAGSNRYARGMERIKAILEAHPQGISQKLLFGQLFMDHTGSEVLEMLEDLGTLMPINRYVVQGSTHFQLLKEDTKQ